jgi:hypothetical protein
MLSTVKYKYSNTDATELLTPAKNNPIRAYISKDGIQLKHGPDSTSFQVNTENVLKHVKSKVKLPQ